MKILICIDDTDNLESIGTGALLQNICAELEKEGLAKGGFVTRHQLFIHEDIEYTSHNSSMCCAAETENIEATTEFSKAYLEANAAEGSDPGICILELREGDSYEKLMEFGKRAQTEVLKKADAFAVAEQYSGILSLSEHGGTGDGVIGALAGVGLRLTGSDGRIKGKIRPKNENEILSVKEFCENYNVQQVVDEEGNAIGAEEKLQFPEAVKAVLMDDKVTVIAGKGDGLWVTRPHKGNKK